jgi:hypothetical protein
VAHTVQQRGATVDTGQRGLEVSSPGDAHELEAEGFAQSFVEGGLHTLAPVGGASVSRAVIHRDPSGAPAAPPPPTDAPTAPAVWHVPELFGGGSENNAADASARLVDIKRELEPLKEHFKGVPTVLTAVENLLLETYGKNSAEPLKPEMASKLEAVGLLAVGAYNLALTEMKAKIRESLGNIKEEKAGEISEKAAEILHATAFGKEADSEALEHAKEGFEKVHIFVEWAHYANEWVTKALQTAQSAEKFEKIAHALEGIGEWGEKGSIAIAALNSALAVYSAIKVSGDPGKSDTKKAVAQTKAGFSLVPVATTGLATIGGLTASATGIGLLWTTLVPQIEQALHMIEQLDERIEAYYKAQSAEEWWEEARKAGGGQAPQIRADQVSHFPGGQPTLNFMWAVFQGSPPETAPALVEKFFYDTRKKMNAKPEGEEQEDQLETEWHLFRANEVKNLIPWVQRHKEEVWAMLYGSLSHP